MAWTQQFADTFTNTQFTSLPTHNAAWTNDYNTKRISTAGTRMQPVGAARSSISTTLADKQYAQLKIYPSEGALTDGPLIRYTALAATYWGFTGYYARYEEADTRINVHRVDNGSATSLGTRTVTLSDGDTLRIEADGSSITVWVNGVQQGAAFTDATYSSGQAGFYAEVGGTEWADDFEAGDEAAGGAPAPQRFLMLG